MAKLRIRHGDSLFRHGERSAAIHGSEFGLLVCHAALAVTKQMDYRASLAVTENL